MSTLSFKQFIAEGGLSRAVRTSMQRNTAQLTANRGNVSSAENKAKNRELGKKVRSLGYGYKKVEGKYAEKDEKTGETKTVREPSIVVNAPKKKFRTFKKQMKRLGKEYNQDSIITKKGKKDAILNPTARRAGTKGMKLGQVKPNRPNPYGETKVKNKSYSYGN